MDGRWKLALAGGFIAGLVGCTTTSKPNAFTAPPPTSSNKNSVFVPEPPDEQEGVFIGMKVRHAKFGVGTIRKLEGSGEGQKAIVWFNSVGPKKLLLRFAGLERA